MFERFKASDFTPEELHKMLSSDMFQEITTAALFGGRVLISITVQELDAFLQASADALRLFEGMAIAQERRGMKDASRTMKMAVQSIAEGTEPLITQMFRAGIGKPGQAMRPAPATTVQLELEAHELKFLGYVGSAIVQTYDHIIRQMGDKTAAIQIGKQLLKKYSDGADVAIAGLLRALAHAGI